MPADAGIEVLSEAMRSDQAVPIDGHWLVASIADDRRRTRSLFRDNEAGGSHDRFPLQAIGHQRRTPRAGPARGAALPYSTVTAIVIAFDGKLRKSTL